MDYRRKSMSILYLSEECQRKIFKYIRANCEIRDNFADIVNFALAHENFERIFAVYYSDSYEKLEFVFVANRRILEIDFAMLETLTKNGDAFLRKTVKAIRQNDFADEVILKYAPESYHSDFLDHFEIIKRALENKVNLRKITIQLNGYSLDDLNNFGYITKLDLDVRMSAEALVKVCKSKPYLKILCFRSTEILGKLSDIAPYCRNLTQLEFAAKPDIDGVEYVQLAELPNLEQMIIYGTSENGSVLAIFEAITKWKRPSDQLLEITFSDHTPHYKKINSAGKNYIFILKLQKDPSGIRLTVSYDFWEISGDCSPLQRTLLTIPLVGAALHINYEGLTLYECPTSDTDINGFISILELFNIQNVNLNEEMYKEIPTAKSIDTRFTLIDRFITSELVKIKSITSLTCTFSNWESLELLSALTNLKTVNVCVKEKFDLTSSKALCSIINTCSAGCVIRDSDWMWIEFRKIGSIKSQRNRITALTIFDKAKPHIFEAFRICRDLITIEELYILKCGDIKIKDILILAEVHPIKKLQIPLADTNNTEHLSDLAELGELEKLTILDSVKGSLIKFFDQMVMKASPSLQCLKIDSKNLSSEELLRVSKIRSLKKLDLCVFEPVDCASLMELANSNVEELSLATSQFSLKKLFSAFAVKTTTRLQHLKIAKYLEIGELEELSKIKTLKSLRCNHFCSDFFFLRNFKHLEKLDIDLKWCSVKLENFESLTLNSWDKNKDLNFLLTNSGILSGLEKVFLLVDEGHNLAGVYQAFTKSLKLTQLTATISCFEEFNEITRIKSLKNLNLYVSKEVNGTLTNFGELPELESLQFNFRNWETCDDTIHVVLSFIKCCKNLAFFLINSDCIFGFYDTFLNDLLSLLKSVTHQRPLAVYILDTMDYIDRNEFNIIEILKSKRITLRSENAYMKIFLSKN